jgi:hypothetical protein
MPLHEEKTSIMSRKKNQISYYRIFVLVVDEEIYDKPRIIIQKIQFDDPSINLGKMIL